MSNSCWVVGREQERRSRRKGRERGGRGGGGSGHPGGGEESERRKDDLLLESEIHIQMNTISMSQTHLTQINIQICVLS